MAERLGDEQISALVAREIALARDDRSEVIKRQTKALEYYQGKMKDIPAEEGRSSVVSRDLSDTIGWMLPGVMRVFTTSDRMALCEPVGEDDAEFARQATEGINYTFWKENDGYRVIYDASWDAMLGGNGIVKVYWDDTPQEVVSHHSGLLEMQMLELVADDEVEVLAHSARVETVTDPDTGEPAQVPVHDVKIVRRLKGGKTVVEAIPPEDFGIDGDAKTCAGARFQYHRSEKTRSDLIEMGFDRQTVESLGPGSRDEAAQIARDDALSGSDGDRSTDLIDLYECYLRVDVDGDGISELCRIYYAGGRDAGEVLDWDVWEDENPFHDIPFEPMPHRFLARSLFDEVEDVAQVKTVMLRQANDNTYASNNPQRFVRGKISNPEELFSPSFGGAIFGEADAEVTPLVVPFVANYAYDALAYQDQVIQRRTGVARQTMALDPDALNNQSATANQNEKDASYSQIELVARNMAEFGWAKVFKTILRLEVKHRDVARTIRMGNKPIVVDPRWWNTEMDVTINVGLGTGSRDRDAAMLTSVLNQQMGMVDRYMATGAPEKAIEMLPYVHNTQVKYAEAVGLKNPESFFPDVDGETVQQLLAKAEERAQKGDPKLEADQQRAAADMQLAQQKAEADFQLQARRQEADRSKAEQEMALKREQLAAEMALKREQLAAELQLKREQFAADLALRRELGMAGVVTKAAQTPVATSGVHMGGEPG